MKKNSGHQAVSTVTPERWETWGKPYDSPAYCQERESGLQQRDRKPHWSPEDSMLRRQNERLHRPWQLGVQDRDQTAVQGTSKFWGSEVPLEYSAEPCSTYLRDKTTREKTPKGGGNDTWRSQGGETVPGPGDQEKKFIILRKLGRASRRFLLDCGAKLTLD